MGAEPKKIEASQELINFEEMIVSVGANILVVGGVNPGETTILNRLRLLGYESGKQDYIEVEEIKDEDSAKQALLIGMDKAKTLRASIFGRSSKHGVVHFLRLNGYNQNIARHVASSIEIIIYQRTLSDGTQLTTEICELISFAEALEPVLNPIFKYDFSKLEHIRVGKITSKSLIDKLMDSKFNNLDAIIEIQLDQ